MKFCLFLTFLQAAWSASISGKVKVSPYDLSKYSIKVGLVPHYMHGGKLVAMSKDVIQGRDCDGGFGGVTPADIITDADGKNDNYYEFGGVEAGNYTVMSWLHERGSTNEWVDFTLPQVGYHQDDGCLMSSSSSTICSTVVSVTEGVKGEGESFENVDVAIRKLSPLPPLGVFVPPVDPETGEEGVAVYSEVREGLRALHNKGTSWQRGFSHGRILGGQILDLFEFFLLDDRVRGSLEEQKYKYDGPGGFKEGILKHMKVSEEFRVRAEGMLEGMRARAKEEEDFSMEVGVLGREFEFADIMAINTYNSYGKISELMNQEPSGNSSHVNDVDDVNDSSNSCTQFIFFGPSTTGDLGTICARNMDGENDLRKLTVRSLTIFAEEPSLSERESQLRVAHVMWPGFVGASSGFNERGTYLMENSGCNPPLNGTVGRVPADEPILRDVIYQVLSNAELGRKPTVEEAEGAILKFKSGTHGGACLDGCILVFGMPSLGDGDGDGDGDVGVDVEGGPEGFLYEGDTWGGTMRVPKTPHVRPFDSSMIMASNHYWSRGVDPLDVAGNGAAMCNGKAATFSSIWRYEAGQDRVEAMLRGKRRNVREGGGTGGARYVTVDDAKQLLRTVTHGTSEHSIIFLPDMMEFLIARSALDAAMNDSPDGEWERIGFEELFQL